MHGYLGVDADTTKTTAGVGIININALQISAAGSPKTQDNIVADGNALAVRGRRGGTVITLFIIDEDGDLYADGGTASTNMVTQYDNFNDAHLVRAFDLARSGRGLVRSQWDEFLDHNEQDLVDLGILGGTVENGGLINVTRLQQLHNGAIWQGYQERQELRARLERYEAALLEMGADSRILEGGVG